MGACNPGGNDKLVTKTNFMIIKSSKKKDDQVSIKIESADGTINVLQRKQKIKYLDVLLDETMSFNHHISYICTRIARNNGIISKLRNYLTLLQMKQIYYSLIYPYISYAILAWGVHTKHILIRYKLSKTILLGLFSLPPRTVNTQKVHFPY